MDNHRATWGIVAVVLGGACEAQQQAQVPGGQIVIEPVAQTPTGSDSAAAPSANVSAQAAEPDTLTEAQRDAVNIALQRGTEKAAKCADGIELAPTGEGDVHVFVDGQKGRIADAIVGPRFARTVVERCIVNAFVGEIVVPFEGPPKEIAIKVTLGRRH